MRLPLVASFAFILGAGASGQAPQAGQEPGGRGSAGNTAAGWRDLVATMVRFSDADAATVSQYLAAHFPPKADRAPTLVAGSATVTFREWITPTLGQRSRDPIQLADGTMWWAGQYGIKTDSKGVIWVSYNGAGKLARMDPATMEVREYPLPNPATRSRRLALTSDDTVWFVNSSLGRIGKLNPATGEVKEWPSPSGPRSHPYAIEVIDDDHRQADA